MKKLAIIVSVVLLLVVGAAVGLFVSGKVAWVGPDTKVVTAKIVCGPELVSKYNDAMYVSFRNNEKLPSLDVEGIKNIKTEIKAKAGYEKDPTCQSMLYLIAIYEEDYEGSKLAYETVKKLHDQGLYADNNIRNNPPLFMYEAPVFGLSPEGKAQPGVGDLDGVGGE